MQIINLIEVSKNVLHGILIILICNIGISKAQVLDFTEVAGQNGITYGFGESSFGLGISLFDFDQDGLDDLTFGGAINESPQFFQNSETGFSQVLFPSIDLTEHHQKCLLWVDYDNDGDLDLSTNNLGSSTRLYRNNDDFNFSDVTTTAGFLGPITYSFAGAWADFNLDGRLDHYTTNRDVAGELHSPNRLLENNANGVFTEVTDQVMVADSQGLGFGVTITDYNRDGWPDIYVANDKFDTHNSLFRNNGNSTFTDVSDPLSTGLHIDGMGIAAGDFDGNGLEDLYVTNSPIVPNGAGGNILSQNLGNDSFVEVAGALDLKVYEIGWGCSWADFDNDGDLDLFVANEAFLGVANSLFINQGNGTFEEDTATQISLINDRSFGCAIGDINDDGYPDIAVMNASPSTVKLWRNNGGTNNWVKVTLEGTTSNSMAIGSWAEAFAGDIHTVRYTRCGTSYGSQDGRAQMFGLGLATVVDSLVITWPTGVSETHYNLPVNQTHHFIESTLVTNAPKKGEFELAVAPNPSSGLFNVVLPSVGAHKIEVTNAIGKTVIRSFNVRGKTTIDLSVFKPGVYFLKSTSLDPNGKLEVVRLINQ